MAKRPGDPITKQRSPWGEVGIPPDVAATLPAPEVTKAYARNVHDGQLKVLVADEPTIGWHLSISFRNHRGEHTRYPTWDEIAHARYELLPHELDFVMHLPPPDWFVSLHGTTFHLHQHPEPGDRK